MQYTYDSPVAYNNALNSQEIHAHLYELKSYPRQVVLDTGNICNQFCKFCFSMQTKQHPVILKAEDFEQLTWLKFADEIIFSGNYGDALANKHFFDICSTVQKIAPHSMYNLYTNGLGLRGKNLDICVDTMSRVSISQNAASENVYNSIITGGNYKYSIENLENLAKRKHSRMHVTLNIVLLRETAHDIQNFVKLAADLQFNSVVVRHGTYQPRPNNQHGLGLDSFLDDYSELVDIAAIQTYAQKRGIDFSCVKHADQLIGECLLPYVQACLSIIRNRPAFDICCASLGRPLLFAKQFSDFKDLKKYWNHPRVQNIRQYVNNYDAMHFQCVPCRRQTPSSILSTKKIAKSIVEGDCIEYDDWGFKCYEDITL